MLAVIVPDALKCANRSDIHLHLFYQEVALRFKSLYKRILAAAIQAPQLDHIKTH